MVQKCLEHGVKISYFHVPPHQINREVFVKVMTCFKCYNLDNHTASNCNKESSYKICSECSSTDHTFRECNSVHKKCVNCGENHSTLAFKCPTRKNIVKQKISSGNKTFASRANPTVTDVYNLNQNNLPQNLYDDYKKSNICIIIASMKNCETPGVFESTLNTLLRANNLPDIKLGGVTPPRNAPFPVEAPPPHDDSTRVPPNISSVLPSDMEGSPVQVQDITIYKRSDVKIKPSKKNIIKMAEEGKVMVHSVKCDESSCLEVLSKYVGNSFPCPIELSVDDFMTKICNFKRNGNPSVSVQNRQLRHRS